ncbi:MAG: hypothetical protein RLW68_11045 [Devosia marina]|uniref:hypothetical protein n=1 Tax=Devosia marina TaxID=2683198 RepID=UPI0032F001FF
MSNEYLRMPPIHRPPSMAEVLRDSNKQRDNPAGYTFASLKREVERFQRGLDEEHEMGMLMAGGIGAIHLRSIKPVDPDLFVFDGLDESQRDVRVIQHYSQVSLVLVALPKLEEQAHRIGFPIPSKEQ